VEVGDRGSETRGVKGSLDIETRRSGALCGSRGSGIGDAGRNGEAVDWSLATGGVMGRL
jgi:hypothetical protein